MSGNNFTPSLPLTPEFNLHQNYRSVETQQKGLNSSRFSSLPMLTSALKPKVDEITHLSPASSPLDDHHIPILSIFYPLEHTHFESTLKSKVIINVICNFLSKHSIHFESQPMKWKFSCSDRINNFVVRLFRNENGSIIVEVQHRSGCLLKFRNIYIQLKSELTSDIPIQNIPIVWVNEECTQMCSETFEANLSIINQSLDTNYYDTQYIILEQLITELNRISHDKINADIIQLLKIIEIKIHQMIKNTFEIKLMSLFERLVMALNLIYEVLNDLNESVNYDITIQISIKTICSDKQTIFMCQSIAALIQKFAVICPNALIQNEIRRGLYQSLAKQSNRDAFKNCFCNYQTQLQNIITSISAK